jgi:Flp pilus assembly protein TadD
MNDGPSDAIDSAKSAAALDLCNDLAWLLANGPDPGARDPSRAVALASRAVEEEPEKASYWNTLGVAYYRAGDCQSAIVALEHAVELGADGTGFDHLFLAMAHARRGDHEGARLWLRRGDDWIETHRRDHLELRRLRDEANDLVRL